MGADLAALSNGEPVGDDLLRVEAVDDALVAYPQAEVLRAMDPMVRELPEPPVWLSRHAAAILAP